MLAGSCSRTPSLLTKTVCPHTPRHSTATHLLRTGLDQVRRILRRTIEFGFFDRDDSGIPLYSPDDRWLVLEEARGGMVLLLEPGSY
jgi:hypothetical protein